MIDHASGNSSNQYFKGSLDVDGRGPSTWDSLILDGTAADSYNRYKEDVQALKQMGLLDPLVYGDYNFSMKSLVRDRCASNIHR
ncbi:hypothetical protein LguiB_033780 [Lonicera macranthoides]